MARLIVRAFVWMRQTVPAYQELAAKLAELEATVGEHEQALGGIVMIFISCLFYSEKKRRA